MDGKKSKFLVIIAIILAVGMAASLVMINNLSQKIENLETQLMNQADRINSVDGSIGSIYSRVDEKLTQQASILSSVESNFGELDSKRLTVPLTVTVVPKKVTGDAKFFLGLGEKEYAFSKSSATDYSVKLDVDLFNTQSVYFIQKENGETKTEQLDLGAADLRYSYLPSIDYADANFSEIHKDGFINFRGDINISCNSPMNMSGVKFESFLLYAEVNGNKVWEQDITSYIVSDGTAHIPFARSFEMDAQKDKLIIYVSAVDSAGLVHRYAAFETVPGLDSETTSAVQVGEVLLCQDGTNVFD